MYILLREVRLPLRVSRDWNLHYPRLFPLRSQLVVTPIKKSTREVPYLLRNARGLNVVVIWRPREAPNFPRIQHERWSWVLTEGGSDWIWLYNSLPPTCTPWQYHCTGIEKTNDLIGELLQQLLPVAVAVVQLRKDKKNDIKHINEYLVHHFVLTLVLYLRFVSTLVCILI